MFDFQCNARRMREEFDHIRHLFDCIEKGTVTVVEDNVFDRKNRVYGYQVIVAFIVEHLLNGLGLPVPRGLWTFLGKEEEQHGIFTAEGVGQVSAI